MRAMRRSIFVALTSLQIAAVAGDAGESSAEGANVTDSCSHVPLEDYDLGFHVGGLFIVMAFSALGTFGTLLLGAVGGNKQWVAQTLQILKMFGTGVIAATAWIHILPDAFEQFANPCLEGHWTIYGTSYVGLFALFAAFMAQLIEFAGLAFGHSYRHTDSSGGTRSGAELQQAVGHFNPPASFLFPSQSAMVTLPPLFVEGGVVADAPTANLNNTKGRAGGDASLPASDRVADVAVSTDNNLMIQRVQTIVLECGILVHSLIIGIALGVTPDSDYASLLIAVCFHQTFEGMALGVMLASTTHSGSCKLLLGAIYPLTTPVGIALGVGLRSSFNTNSQAAIVTQGVFDSLSAGILIYNTYAELISSEVNQSQKFRTFSAPFQACCFLSMYLGAAAMAVLGLWA